VINRVLQAGSGRAFAALPDPYFQDVPGEGMGKPGFPIPLLEGQALPRAGAWGNPVFPYPA